MSFFFFLRQGVLCRLPPLSLGDGAVADSLVWIEKFLADQVKTTFLGEVGTTVRLCIKYQFGTSV